MSAGFVGSDAWFSIKMRDYIHAQLAKRPDLDLDRPMVHWLENTVLSDAHEISRLQRNELVHMANVHGLRVGHHDVWSDIALGVAKARADISINSMIAGAVTKTKDRSTKPLARIGMKK